ncbi:MAG: ribonuclease HII, partial [Sulfolobales archaeon]
MGIDEAGRGSLIGDLFVAGVALSDEQGGTLSGVGVRDSK